jgi:hypothetical protein
MKVTNEHLEAMRSSIVPLDTDERRQRYINKDFPRSDAVKDLDMRYRWDLFWESGAIASIQDMGYANAHIDTALRNIVSSLCGYPESSVDPRELDVSA